MSSNIHLAKPGLPFEDLKRVRYISQVPDFKDKTTQHSCERNIAIQSIVCGTSKKL